jgi:hypothetical protein
MPAGSTVRPQRWSNIINLYDDGTYSAIWGNYDNSPNHRLGVRWNGDPGVVGYPGQGSYPTWYVEPDFLTKQILLELRAQVVKNNAIGNTNSIDVALQEC